MARIMASLRCLIGATVGIVVATAPIDTVMGADVAIAQSEDVDGAEHCGRALEYRVNRRPGRRSGSSESPRRRHHSQWW